MNANAIFELLGLALQLVVLGCVLGVVGWQVRKFLNARAESRRLERARQVAALVSATRSRSARHA
ncbi:hypothetical protein D3C71_23980 [compost metagenome]